MYYDKFNNTSDAAENLKPKVFYNLSRKEKEGLRWLQNQPDLIVVPADKNVGLCIMDKSDYIDRIRVELQKTPDSYNKLSFSIDDLNIRRKSSFSRLEELGMYFKQQFGGPTIIKYIMQPSSEDFKICKLKGMPKLHKAGRRMRLIYPFKQHPMGKLHKFLAKSLESFVVKIDSVITHVVEIIDQVSGVSFDKGTIFCSADISSMYPNIDRTKALKISAETLSTAEFNIFSFNPILMWSELLKIAHKDLEFEFDNELFEQTKGVPMGSPAGPQIAINYLHKSIVTQWEELKTDLIFGGFYFDDGFFIFKPGVKDVSNKIKNILINTSLQFDEDSIKIINVEELINQPLNILDISISSTSVENDKYSCFTKVYTKEIGSSQYVHWKSSHPPSIKRSIIKGELLRRLRLTDRIDDWWKTKSDLYTKLIKRDYPPALLNAEFQKVSFEEKVIQREKLSQKIKNRRLNMKFQFSGELKTPSESPTIPMVVRYDPRSLRTTKRKRKELEENINEILQSTNYKIKRIRIINAFTVSGKLSSQINKKHESVLSLNPQPPLEIAPIDSL